MKKNRISPRSLQALGLSVCVVALCGCQKGVEDVTALPSAPAATSPDPLLEDLADNSTLAVETPKEADTSEGGSGARGRVALLMADLAQKDKSLRSNPLFQGLDDPLDIGQYEDEVEVEEPSTLVKASRAFNNRYRENDVDIWVLERKEAKEEEVKLSTEEIAGYVSEVMHTLEEINSEVYTYLATKKLGQLVILTTDQEGLRGLKKQAREESESIVRVRDVEVAALQLGVEYLVKQNKKKNIKAKLRLLESGLREQEGACTSLEHYYNFLYEFIDFELDNWESFWDGDDGLVLRSEALRGPYTRLTSSIIGMRQDTDRQLSKTRALLGELLTTR
jgi:hypothetical protein